MARDAVPERMGPRIAAVGARGCHWIAQSDARRRVLIHVLGARQWDGTIRYLWAVDLGSSEGDGT